MKQRWFPLLCAALLLLTLSACGSTDGPALTVNGVPVSQGVFQYYKHNALQHPEAYGLQPGDETGAASQAEAQCRRLVALDHYLKQHKITVRAVCIQLSG